MKAHSFGKPPNYFYYVNPRNTSLTTVRFCDNLTEVKDGWEYSEYRVEIPTCSNMDEYIQNHYMELHAEAIGGPSAIQQLYANFDYLSMMTGVDIPMGGDVPNG